ncbi:hypothetical protein QYE76_046631 [Lolium multiflorum]|uniref:RRM domain-containing protein n=1 Tax=Lolium multiflorum TaxID=4521 RepID=A0AAD8TPV5_LOLMU|nr:hypothetical protein QYE76_046631 [Lolium multiflorum]
MAPKKRKADPAQSAALAAAAASDPAATNHHQDLPSPDLKPRGTIYFPIADDPPEPAADAADDDDGADGDDKEDVAKMLEPLSREQLVDLLRAAAEASPATMAAVRLAAEADPASRKLFVHGLGWGAGADDLRSAFSRFGDLEDCRVICDKQSGKSKGYGFVLFRSRGAAKRALRRPQLQIGGRLAFCHLAASGPAPPSAQAQNPSSNSNTNTTSGITNTAPASSSSSQPDNMQRKIFVGNVHADVDVDRLYEYFSQFGEIEEGPLGFDKSTGRPKGFALFVYKHVDSARRALEDPNKSFDGKVLNVQKAIDGRSKTPGSNSNANPSATAASAQMTAPAIATINPYDPASVYGATSVHDMGFAQQAAMLGLGAQQQAFAQPNTAMLAMMAAAMQNPAVLAALNPAFAAMGAGGQHTGIPGFGAQGFGTQGFGAAGVNFPTAAGLQGAASYQGGPPGFQGTPGFPTSAGFQVGQAATQAAGTTAAAAGAAGYQAGAAGQGQVPSSQTGFQGGY